MNRREVCLVAIFGVLIAFVTIPVGVFFALVQGTREHWGAAQAFLWLATGGGVVGLTIFFGALLPWGNPDPKPNPPEYRRCSNCAVENFLWREHCQMCGKPLGHTRGQRSESAH